MSISRAKGLKPLFKVDDGNLLDKNMRTVTKTLVDLELQGSYILILWLVINMQVTTATCCRLVYSYKNVSLLKVLEKTITNQIYPHKEIS